jgi:hypothetical protein
MDADQELLIQSDHVNSMDADQELLIQSDHVNNMDADQAGEDLTTDCNDAELFNCDLSRPTEFKKTVISRLSLVENSEITGYNAVSDLTSLIIYSFFNYFQSMDLVALKKDFLGFKQTLPNDLGKLFWESYLGYYILLIVSPSLPSYNFINLLT